MAGEIFEAIRSGDRDRVAALIAAQPAAARERDSSGVSALMRARYTGNMEIVAMLRSAAGELDIFEAAALGDVDRVKTLLAPQPALVNSYSPDGFTALHLASYFSQPNAAEELIRHGADANAVATNGSRLAVINSAAASGNAEIVKIVLRAGANANAQQHGGYTALHAAAQRNNAEMVTALLAAGADPAIRDDSGKLPAELAGAEGAELLNQE